MKNAEMPVLKFDRNGLIRCRVCGCTEVDACNPPCSWVDQDLCSGCDEAAKAIAEWLDGARRANHAALLREAHQQHGWIREKLVARSAKDLLRVGRTRSRSAR